MQEIQIAPSLYSQLVLRFFFTDQKLSKVFLKGTRPLHCLFIRFYPTIQYTICQFKIYPYIEYLIL